MIIELISKRDYNKLLHRQKKYPKLTFQNKGYEYIDKSKFSGEDIKAFDEVTTILSKSIKGFSEFNNFQVINGIIRIRFQYDWSYGKNSISFIGVGYLELEELYKGFKENHKNEN